MAVRLHRRFAAHRLARRADRPRLPRLRADRPRRRDLGRSVGPGPSAVRAGDEHARGLRGRRRPARLDEAGRLRRRRGRDVDLPGPPLPGDDLTMDIEELRGIELFTGLTDDQLADLAASGEEVPFEPGDTVFAEGEHADHWWVLLTGSPHPRPRGGRGGARR